MTTDIMSHDLYDDGALSLKHPTNIDYANMDRVTIEQEAKRKMHCIDQKVKQHFLTRCICISLPYLPQYSTAASTGRLIFTSCTSYPLHVYICFVIILVES